MKTRFGAFVLGGGCNLLAAFGVAMLASSTASATTIFTSNLSSETTPAGDTTGPNFQLNYNGGTVAGITNTSPGGVLGFNFVYSSPTSANLVGAYNNGGGQSIKLDSAVLPDLADTQDNGFFLALDSVYQTAAINININTIFGDSYTVTFDWAGTQQAGYTGASTDFLTVALGSSPAQVTTPISVAQQGFTGWNTVSYTFTAGTTGVETLSFLAGGTPTGVNQEPAMTLLDNISVSQTTLTPTPEPSTLTLMASGLLGLYGFGRWRMKKSAATSF